MLDRPQHVVVGMEATMQPLIILGVAAGALLAALTQKGETQKNEAGYSNSPLDTGDHCHGEQVPAAAKPVQVAVKNNELPQKEHSPEKSGAPAHEPVRESADDGAGESTEPDGGQPDGANEHEGGLSENESDI